MKGTHLTGLLGASLALLAGPALAQDAPPAKPAPPAPKAQRVVIHSQEPAPIDAAILKKAAELSAKASELAAAGKSQEAAKFAAKAAALLQDAQAKSADAQVRVHRAESAERRAQAEMRRAEADKRRVDQAVERKRAIELRQAAKTREAEGERRKLDHDLRAQLLELHPELKADADGKVQLKIATELRAAEEAYAHEVERLRERQGEFAFPESGKIRLNGEIIDFQGKPLEGNVIILDRAGKLLENEAIELDRIHEHLAQLGDLGFKVRKTDGENKAFEAFGFAVPDAQLHDEVFEWTAEAPGMGAWVFDMTEGQECEACEDGQPCQACTDRAQAHSFEWRFAPPQGDSPFGHAIAPQAGHDVHVLRSSPGGEIIIHGGDGEQNIIIQGRMMLGDGHLRGLQLAPKAHGENVDVEVRVAPQTSRTPGPSRGGNVFFSPGPQTDGQIYVTPQGESEAKVLFKRKSDAPLAQPQVRIERKAKTAPQGLLQRRPVPADASAPAPGKLDHRDARELIEEMRKEMEALRQELSDLRRQMKDDPLVQAQRQTWTQDGVTAPTVLATTDRRRAGLTQ